MHPKPTMPPKYLIDKLLPSNEVHIIAGPSGSGKTTWILQTLVEQWQHGKDVLGFPSHPVPWFYISSDRSLQSVHATMERIGISVNDFNLTSAVDAGIHDISELLRALKVVTPRPQLLYIDGLLNLLPEKVHPNDNKSVCKWLADLTRTCQKEDITIWGSLHSPKMKKDEGYDNPRQRISGGASWAGFADTIFIMEPEAPDDEDDSGRKLIILPRNYRKIVCHLVFNDKGRLVDLEREESAPTLLAAFLSTIKPGASFTRETLSLVFEKTPPKAIDNWITRSEIDGLIVKQSRGKYVKSLRPPL